jgi:autophagy-related protein 9
MMTSNLLSRFLPPTGSASIYEAIRQDDEASEASDVEERAGMALDEENLREPLQHYDPEDALAHAADSQITTQSTAFLGQRYQRKTKTGRHGTKSARPRWMQASPRVLEADEGDDDVPASLLVEGHEEEDYPRTPAPPPHHNLDGEYPDPGPSSRETPGRWEAARVQQPLHPFTQPSVASRRRPGGGLPNLASVSPKDKAMWRWANVENLDNFLKEVYVYFLGNGIWCIILGRVLNLLYVCLYKFGRPSLMLTVLLPLSLASPHF